MELLSGLCYKQPPTIPSCKPSETIASFSGYRSSVLQGRKHIGDV